MNNLFELIAKHKNNINEEKVKLLAPIEKGDCTSVEDLLILYALILENKPKYIVEFSPMLGYSTCWLASAMKEIGRKHCMFSVEQNTSYFNRATKRIKNAGLSEYCDVLHGNALDVVPKIIIERKWENQVGLAFIDSSHTKNFANQYIQKIFPLLSSCLAMVHDIAVDNNKFNNQDDIHVPFFCPMDREDKKEKYKEYVALQDYLQNKQWILTSYICGNIPFCLEPAQRTGLFYSEINTLIGFDFLQYLNWVSPLGLLFRIENKT